MAADAKATSIYVNNECDKHSSPYNLLDNSDFTNPVNQRWKTTYNATSRQYTIDRWMVSSNSTVNVVSGIDSYIKITNNADAGRISFQQILGSCSNYIGKTYTIACTDSEGVVYCMSDIVPEPSTTGTIYFCSANFNGHSLRLAINSNTIWIEFMIANGSFLKIKNVAMYEGEYTIDNIPNYVKKEYAVELLNCQKYYYYIPSTATICYPAYIFNSTLCRVTIKLPAAMISTPTLTTANIDNFTIYANASSYNVTEAIINNMDHDSVCIYLTGSFDSSVRAAATVRFNTTVTLSADY